MSVAKLTSSNNKTPQTARMARNFPDPRARPKEIEPQAPQQRKGKVQRIKVHSSNRLEKRIIGRRCAEKQEPIVGGRTHRATPRRPKNRRDPTSGKIAISFGSLNPKLRKRSKGPEKSPWSPDLQKQLPSPDHSQSP